MYCIRRSVLRKYTFAALNGADEVTVPETLASPLSSDCAAALALKTSENAASQMAMRIKRASSTKTSRIYSGPPGSASLVQGFLATIRAAQQGCSAKTRGVHAPQTLHFG